MEIRGGIGNKTLYSLKSIREEKMKEYLKHDSKHSKHTEEPVKYSPILKKVEEYKEVRFEDIVERIEVYNTPKDFVPKKINYLFEVKEFFVRKILLYFMRYTDGKLYDLMVERLIRNKEWVYEASEN